MPDDELDERDAARLADLKKHWGDVYEFIHYPGGRWYAIPKAASGEPLIADTERELRAQVRSDYTGGGQ